MVVTRPATARPQTDIGRTHTPRNEQCKEPRHELTSLTSQGMGQDSCGSKLGLGTTDGSFFFAVFDPQGTPTPQVVPWVAHVASASPAGPPAWPARTQGGLLRLARSRVVRYGIHTAQIADYHCVEDARVQWIGHQTGRRDGVDQHISTSAQRAQNKQVTRTQHSAGSRYRGDDPAVLAGS